MLQSLALLAGLSGAAAPPAAPAADTVTIPINAVTGLQFDRVRFQVPAGAPVKIVYRNTDPTDDMDHNLVITRPGARMTVVNAGMTTPREQNHVPRMPEVLFSTPVLKEGESFTLTFTAPTASGAYPYVCTFPGHGFVMYGVMYVAMEMPALTMDENVPPNRRTPPAAGGGGAPARPAWTSIRANPGVSYGTTFPAISRTFLPESGPASIAVGFEDGESYNFDAGDSYLRYAWTGGFVDNVKHWAGNGNAYGDIVGRIYYRSSIGFPLRVGGREDAEAVKFLGYRLVEGGLPEFHYTVDGADVRERISRRPGGSGLVRTFAIQSTEPVRFLTEPDAAVKFESSAGRWSGPALELTAAQARQFTITMVPAAGGAR
jgi:azurin